MEVALSSFPVRHRAALTQSMTCMPPCRDNEYSHPQAERTVGIEVDTFDLNITKVIPNPTVFIAGPGLLTFLICGLVMVRVAAELRNISCQARGKRYEDTSEVTSLINIRRVPAIADS